MRVFNSSLGGARGRALLTPLTFILTVLLAAFTTFTPPAQAQTVSDATNIDGRWNRSWPAGPFSQVSTSWGVLQTEVPLFSLEGPGGTSIGFSIYHRSGQQGGSSWGVVDGGAGRGWSQSAISGVNAGGNGSMVQNKGGNIGSWWGTNINNGVITQFRRPGTRADLLRLYDGQGTHVGYEVTEQADKSRYTYREVVASQTAFRLTSVTDTHNNTINVEYDAQGRHLPVKVTDASGARYYTIAYNTDPNPQISGVTLVYPGGSKTWNFYYTGQKLDYILYPAPVAGGTRPRVSFGYDVATGSTSETNLVDVYDLKGNRWHYVYGPTYVGSSVLGVQTLHEPTNTLGTWNNANYTTFAWSAPGNAGTDKICSVTDQLGRVWKHVYATTGGSDGFSNPIKSVQDPYVAADNANYSDTYTWNYTDATLTNYRDRRGNLWEFGYDANNRGLTYWKRNPLGSLTQMFYDANDKLIRTIDPNGDRTLFTYAPGTLDLTKTVVDPKTDPYDAAYSRPAGVALTTNYTYRLQGEVTSAWTGSDAAVVSSNFDAYGNAQTVTAPSGAATTFTFDALNNKKSVTEPSPGGTTNFTYDEWNRLTRVTHPGGSAYAETTYDLNGSATLVRDENGFATTTVFDGLNRPLNVKRPVDGVTANDIVVTHSYDAVGNRTHITNGRGKVTVYAPNERHEVTQITYPDNTTRRFGYDANGNKNREWDGQNRLFTYEYDTANRLFKTTVPGPNVITNTWRADNVLTARNDDWLGTTTWAVNGAGQVTQAYQPRVNKTVTYTYDAGGRKKTVSLDAQTWTFNYNAALQLQSVAQTVGASTAATFNYHPNGALYYRDSPKQGSPNLRTLFGYDARGRTTSIAHHRWVNGVEQEDQYISYGYDAAGNMVSYADNTFDRGSATTTYDFDRANRLTSESRTNSTGGFGGGYSIGYAYDKSNNRTQVTRNGVTSAYSVDDNDKFLSGDGFSASGYDGNGNPGSLFVPGEGTYGFEYDYKNRPWHTTRPGGGQTYYNYDGDGRRIEKTVANVYTTRYVYDGNTIIGEVDPNASSIVKTFHLPGVGFTSSAGAQSYYNESALGSTLAVRDVNGNFSSRSEYDAYGITGTILQGTRSSFQFAGKHGYVTDEDTGMQLLGHRFYLPRLGRFLTQDPIGQAGGLNLYGYCENNPLTRVDPDGTDIVFITPGASTAQRAQFIHGVNAALATIRRTPHGRYMLEQVDGSKPTGRDLHILRTPGLGNHWGRLYRDSKGLRANGYVKVDTDIINHRTYQFRNLKTGQLYQHTYPMWRILAHEMGHAVEGDPDRSPVNWRDWDYNLRNNENPVARALGQDPRVNYKKTGWKP